MRNVLTSSSSSSSSALRCRPSGPSLTPSALAVAVLRDARRMPSLAAAPLHRPHARFDDSPGGRIALRKKIQIRRWPTPRGDGVKGPKGVASASWSTTQCHRGCLQAAAARRRHRCPVGSAAASSTFAVGVCPGTSTFFSRKKSAIKKRRSSGGGAAMAAGTRELEEHAAYIR